jgi:hypothetical protein
VHIILNSKETSLIKSKILVTIALIQSCFSKKNGVYKYINILLLADINKCQRKPKGQSRMDKPETLAMLGTQDTRQRQTRDTGNIGHTTHKTKTNKTQKHNNTEN